MVNENALAGTIPVWPVVVEDGDEPSDDNRSIADDAAPMAKNMTQDPQRTEESDKLAHAAASRVPRPNRLENNGFFDRPERPDPAELAVPAEISHTVRKPPRRALNQLRPRVRRGFNRP